MARRRTLCTCHLTAPSIACASNCCSRISGLLLVKDVKRFLRSTQITSLVLCCTLSGTSSTDTQTQISTRSLDVSYLYLRDINAMRLVTASALRIQGKSFQMSPSNSLFPQPRRAAECSKAIVTSLTITGNWNFPFDIPYLRFLIFDNTLRGPICLTSLPLHRGRRRS